MTSLVKLTFIAILAAAVSISMTAWAKKARKPAPSASPSAAASAGAGEIANPIPVPSASVASPAAKTKAKPPRKPIREKDTEGSEAADRFEKDPVIKSPYQLDGEQLEVDPD